MDGLFFPFSVVYSPVNDLNYTFFCPSLQNSPRAGRFAKLQRYARNDARVFVCDEENGRQDMRESPPRSCITRHSRYPRMARSSSGNVSLRIPVGNLPPSLWPEYSVDIFFWWKMHFGNLAMVQQWESFWVLSIFSYSLSLGFFVPFFDPSLTKFN